MPVLSQDRILEGSFKSCSRDIMVLVKKIVQILNYPPRLHEFCQKVAKECNYIQRRIFIKIIVFIP